MAMVRLSDLQAQVSASYDRLAMPSWPNPHLGGASPRDEEYSRVTAPERYRIVHARAAAWVDALTRLVAVDAEPFEGGSLDTERYRGSFDRGVRLRSHRTGTLPLMLLERDVATTEGDGTLAVLLIGVVEPDLVLEDFPDCGCDACDSGSENLLGAIDDAIGSVVSGPFVVLRGTGWQAQWHPARGAAHATRGSGLNARDAKELCRRFAAGEDVRLPRGTEAFVGRSWLD